LRRHALHACKQQSKRIIIIISSRCKQPTKQSSDAVADAS
jgi:hypothetical protein